MRQSAKRFTVSNLWRPTLHFPTVIIVDMDGVLVDGNPFHLRKWIDLFQAHGIPYVEQDLPKIILGPPNEVIFRRYLGENLSREQLAELGEELEANFRREIGPHARAFPGVRRFIEECHAAAASPWPWLPPLHQQERDISRCGAEASRIISAKCWRQSKFPTPSRIRRSHLKTADEAEE